MIELFLLLVCHGLSPWMNGAAPWNPEDSRDLVPEIAAHSGWQFQGRRRPYEGAQRKSRGFQMHILVVEDEKGIAAFVKRGLEEEKYAVDVAGDTDQALFLVETNTYDLIVLDVMLPGKDGVSVCRELREKKVAVPILMLTAKSSVKDRVAGLDAGADDYLTKPFAFEEFLARIRVLLRRKDNRKNTVLKVDDLQLDQVTHKVTRGGNEIGLTTKEYALLEYLMVNANQVVTRTMISEHVWDEDFDTFTNVIDVYINYLRKKVDKDFKKKLIYTLRGTGYILKGAHEA